MPDQLAQFADDAYEAIRALNHRVSGALPAPVIYELLGDLKSAGGYGLAQALHQMSDALVASLDVYEVTEASDLDPRIQATLASARIEEAVNLSTQVGRLLDDAQSAIAAQGYSSSDI
ncbi:hypothetical protein [Microbacterium enclense]|uniref:hypothetical protein n=1 Tax=Microbacterium enclense TaxID=993073 RepID=UPI003F7F9CAE